MTEPVGLGPCKTCGNTWDWHQANVTQHAYNDGSISVSQTFGQKMPDGSRSTPGGAPVVTEVHEQAWPFDPVLRQALIDKGVLSPEDLREAEDKIRAVTSQMTKGVMS